jgi:hypothetical protein
LLDSVTPLPPSGRVLHSHRHQVEASNAAFIANLHAHKILTPPRIHVQGQGVPADYYPIAYDDLDSAEKTYVQKHASGSLACIALQVRVRLTATVNKASGATNGSSGTVVGFTFSDPDQLTAIRVLLDHNQRTVSVHRTFPVASCPSNRYLRVCYWPLDLEHASTTHCLQGASVTTMLAIDLQTCFVHGMAYVALSRNTDTSMILLRRPLTVHDLRVISLPAFYQAYQHLHSPH